MSKIVLATGNLGKVAEMQSTLQDFGFEVVPQTEFKIESAVEDGLSYIENAIIKARHACHHTGLPAIADDSGLQVNALQGAPGIYAARYANEQEVAKHQGNQDAANNAKLLEKLNDIDDRRASFQCVIVFMQHANDPTPIIAQGLWQGKIARQPAGDHGFGYDPLFYIPELDCHSAQLEAEQKKQLSHRAKALANLKKQLELQQTS